MIKLLSFIPEIKIVPNVAMNNVNDLLKFVIRYKDQIIIEFCGDVTLDPSWNRVVKKWKRDQPIIIDQYVVLDDNDDNRLWINYIDDFSDEQSGFGGTIKAHETKINGITLYYVFV